MIFAILGDAANAYNAIAWKDAFTFILCLIGLYWVKVKIDTRAGLGKKKLRQLKEVIKKYNICFIDFTFKKKFFSRL